MTTVQIHGPAPSSYVRTARMVCEEKGIAHELIPIQPGSEAHLELHPYGRFPALTHGHVRLWETQAIARYIDDAFDGPSLTPSDAGARARMEQWVSMLSCYLYDDAIRNYALKYIFPGENGPDRAAIDGALPRLERGLDLLERAYRGGPWVVGEQLTLADLFVLPVVGTASLFPEVETLLGARPSLGRALGAMAERPSWAKVTPAS